jgi:hypothetical protein
MLSDLNLNGSEPEIEIKVNSNITNWHYGTEANTPQNKYDFVSVILHEITHGLGYAATLMLMVQE